MSVFTITMLNIARAWHLANISCAHMQANKNLVRYCGKKTVLHSPKCGLLVHNHIILVVTCFVFNRMGSESSVISKHKSMSLKRDYEKSENLFNRRLVQDIRNSVEKTSGRPWSSQD